jgi:membrane protein implicated in regulation of membrane protease activity
MNFETFMAVISKNYLIYFWLIISILFLLAEILTPGLFFFIAFAIGSCFVVPFVIWGYGFSVQCLVALIASLIAFFVLRRFCAVRGKESSDKTNVEALVGKIGIVIKEIRFGESGQVKVGGEIWSAKLLKDDVIKKYVKVRIVRVDGNHLVVVPFFH